MTLNNKQKEARLAFLEKLKNKEYKMIDRKCLCGERSSNSRIIYSKDRYNLPLTTIICNNCGLVRSNPYYDSNTLSKFYDNEYRIFYTGDNIPTENFFKDEISIGKNIISFLRKNIKLDINGKKVYEIGCGAGGILIPFVNMGAIAYGCDLGSSYISYGKTQGLNLEVGNYTKLKKHGKADIIILNHVLEHMIDPLKELKGITELLNEDGIIYIAVPGVLNHHNTYGSLHNYLQNAHIYNFSRQTLENLCTKVGLKMIIGDEKVMSIFKKGKGNLHIENVNRIYRYLKLSIYLSPLFNIRKWLRNTSKKQILGLIRNIFNFFSSLPLLSSILTTLRNGVYFSKSKKYLINNSKLNNKFRGKRCFIIGNGPSIKKQDLSKLKNEYTFCVNSVMNSPEFEKISPKFYVISDSNFFKEENIFLQKSMNVLFSSKVKPMCFFPIKFRKYIQSKGWYKKLEVKYFFTDVSKTKIKELDLTKPMPPYFNVINQVLYIAISMGFSEIYLLGCDMTGFVYLYDEQNKPYDSAGHFFNSKEQKEHTQKILERRRNENMLKAYGKVFEYFRLTNDYAISKGIDITNATLGGALDVFPREKYELILKKKYEKNKKYNKKN